MTDEDFILVKWWFKYVRIIGLDVPQHIPYVFMECSMYRLIALFSIFATYSVEAKPIPLITTFEENGRLTINWASQKVRFYGIGDEGVFEASERKALREGLTFLSSRAQAVRASLLRAAKEETFSYSLRGATNAVYSVGTTYFANGSVKMDLETRLSRVLFPAPKSEVESSVEGEKCSEVRLILSSTTFPQAIYQLFAGQDAVFSMSDVEPYSLQTRLMGRWYKGKGLGGRGLVGSIFRADIEDIGIGRYKISQNDWDALKETCDIALRTGRISLVVPK